MWTFSSDRATAWVSWSIKVSVATQLVNTKTETCFFYICECHCVGKGNTNTLMMRLFLHRVQPRPEANPSWDPRGHGQLVWGLPWGLHPIHCRDHFLAVWPSMSEIKRFCCKVFNWSLQKLLSGFFPLRGGGLPPISAMGFWAEWLSVNGGGGYPPIPLRKKSAKNSYSW